MCFVELLFIIFIVVMITLLYARLCEIQTQRDIEERKNSGKEVEKTFSCDKLKEDKFKNKRRQVSEDATEFEENNSETSDDTTEDIMLDTIDEENEETQDEVYERVWQQAYNEAVNFVRKQLSIETITRLLRDFDTTSISSSSIPSSRAPVFSHSTPVQYY
ncbi:hypothetical protein J6590_081856 [Homalodisca vitripennis]|nr:hypothetical protein J6590_081856 [Homalodisca vitripennis]